MMYLIKTILTSFVIFTSCNYQIDKKELNIDKNLENNQSLHTLGINQAQYFGFWGSAMNGVGNGNYINDTKGFSNIAFIRADNISEWKSKISEAKNVSQLSILMVQNHFFPWASSQLYSNADHRFKSFWNSLEPSLQDSVLGFYIFDEPYWNNSFNSWDSVSKEQLQKNLKECVNIINQTTIGKKTMLTFAYPTVNSHLLMPDNVDWIGVNCYASFGNACSENAVTGYMNILKQKKSAFQKFMLTVDSYWDSPPNSQIQNTILDRIVFWEKWMNNQNDVIAVTPFIWQSHVPEKIYGADSMPLVREKLKKIGAGIIKPQNQTCNLLEPQCEGKDYVKRDSCGNEIERKVNSLMCQNQTCTILEPKCEGDDFVKRDSCGNEIERIVKSSICYSPQCIVLQPKCEGMDSVRRDSCGNEIERWVNAPHCSTVNCIVLEPKCEGDDFVKRDSCGNEIERNVKSSICYSPQCIVLEPKCEGMDSVRRDSCGTEIERWINAPHCSTVKCEGNDYVRRDSTGKEVERWVNAPPPYCN